MAAPLNSLASFGLDYPSHPIGQSLLVQADCFVWLSRIPENSIHAVVTDPPYGVKEYEHEQLEKRANGKGGIWRIPPSFDGSIRQPLPRFTALNPRERKALDDFFVEWARLVTRALRPSGHLFIASNAFISQLTFEALVKGGLEWRGELIRRFGARIVLRMPTKSFPMSRRCREAATNRGESCGSHCRLG